MYSRYYIPNKNDLKCRKRKQSRARAYIYRYIFLIYDEWRCCYIIIILYYSIDILFRKTERFHTRPRSAAPRIKFKRQIFICMRRAYLAAVS